MALLNYIGYKISGDDTNNENNYTAGSNNNDNPNSLAEIKHTNNKSPQLIIATPPASRSLVVTSEGLITPTELGKDFQKEVLHTLSFIKHELRRIVNNQRDLTQRYDVMESILEKMQSSSDLSHTMNKSSTPITDVTGSYSLPLDNSQDLEIFEERISEDSTFRINLVSQLSYLGGKHVKAVVKRLMGKLFKDELLKDFSYTGKKGKKKFSTLTTCSVIFDAVKTQAKFKQVSQSEMEDIIKYILAQAPFNIKRLTKDLH
eukprot:XP_016662229.1 PREDICTED: uncharacterized protein LOC107884500 [Acyrthosiphon pisum]